MKNLQGTLAHFAQLEMHLRKRHSIYLDLSQVQILTPDAIMYLLATMDVHKQRGYLNIRGNNPIVPTANQLWEASGFDEFVTTHKSLERTSNVLSIKVGTQADGRVLGLVLKWALARLGRTEDAASQANFVTMMECIQNTAEHANRGRSTYIPQWWLSAVYDPAREIVTFTVLDYGVGIARTVRTDLHERVRQYLGHGRVNWKALGIPFFNIDHRLVLSAMQGGVRSSTLQPHRGYGLPRIYSNYRNNFTGGLVVISDRAHINFHNAVEEDVPSRSRLEGTLVTWEFSKTAPEAYSVYQNER